MPTDRSLLRHLPSVDQLKQHRQWRGVMTRDAVQTVICREIIATLRAQVLAEKWQTPAQIDAAATAALTAALALLNGPILRPVLNGLGVLIHTNAGRAPLSAAALARVVATTGAYCNLEFSLLSGERGSRQDLLRDPMRWLFGGEDALVVNNGAAAIMLVLHALSPGRPALVSRGELVEIGGSFRVPDVMAAAGARLVEVGTTNRTWPRDYAHALDDLDAAGTPAAVMMQVHRSNFSQAGFVHTPTVAELAEIAQAHAIPLVVDLGSGVVDDLNTWGLQAEPTVRQTLEAGADIVTFSGDKLLGGPQSGLIVGKRAYLKTIARAPMARAVRVDGMVLAALEETLRSHLRGRATAELPLWQAVDLSQTSLRRRGELLVTSLGDTLDHSWRVTLRDCEATLGGGAQPGATLPSIAICLHHHGQTAAALVRALRQGEMPVLARPRQDEVWLDLRSLIAGAGVGMEQALTAALVAI